MTNTNFNTFINNYRNRLSELFAEDNYNTSLATSRGLPPDFLNKILECGPLSVFIPREYGGRGSKTSETLSMLETSSYYSLPLSLMMGINGALFLLPVAGYSNDEVKKEVFGKFLEEQNMGGLMITEPEHGSDALRMQTGFTRYDGGYRVRGLKHWAGLTGQADYWLMTAREMDLSGKPGRDIGFFIHDAKRGGITVEEYFPNLGLYMLPYGRNKIDISIPEKYRLKPATTGVTMMLDVLHRSRLYFPGMGTGFLKRMLDESVSHAKKRLVGGVSLSGYDQVKERLARLQAWFTSSSAMSFFTASNISATDDTSRLDLAANSIKALVTDYMQEAAQSFLQLTGAKGYRLDHLAGRSVVDSRPFQIFEGSNDILYQQITESVLKLMRKKKVNNLFDFFKGYSLSEKSAGYLRDSLDFEVDFKMPQRKMVELGRAVSRVVTMNMTIDLGAGGFNQEMISNGLKVLQQEIHTIIASFNYRPEPIVVEEYQSDSNWLSYMEPS